MNTLDVLKRIGKVIKSNKNIDIAESLGVEESTCSNWKKRKSIPIKYLENFANAHDGVTIQWLLNGTEENKSPSTYKSESPPDIGTLINLIKQTIDKKDTDSDILLSSMDALLKKQNDPSRAAGGSRYAVPKKTGARA